MGSQNVMVSVRLHRRGPTEVVWSGPAEVNVVGLGRVWQGSTFRAEEGCRTAVRAIYCQMDSSRRSAQTGTAAGPPPLFSRPRRTAGSKPLHCPAGCEPVRSLDRGPCPEASHPLHSDQVQRGCCHRILQDTQSQSPQLPPPNGHEGIQKPRRISEYLTKRCIAYMWRVRSYQVIK